MKLQVEVVNGRLQRSVEALVHGKGLPGDTCGICHKSSSTTIGYVLSWNAKFPQFNGTNSVVQNFRGSEGSSDVVLCTI